jgi:glutathione synthase/RimK-type ligase-like ATP-grasp enzyme
MNKYPKRNIDVCILTDSRNVDLEKNDLHYQSILIEDGLVREHLERRGLKVHRCSWDDLHFDWTRTSFILFRTTWDYFDRFPEFSAWLEKVRPLTSMINPYEIIKWNLDKHYLLDLAGSGINIPPTLFLEKGEAGSLSEKVAAKTWKEIILKPVVSGAARHTYRFLPEDAGKHEKVYQELIRNEAMMIQEFQVQVPIKGEVAFMVFDGYYSHAILKKARDGDFRVQDDFGGSVFVYEPSKEEIRFAEEVVKRCGYDPLYARVDVLWDNQGKLSLSELELIEPELWFRLHSESAGKLADAIIKRHFNN